MQRLRGREFFFKNIVRRPSRVRAGDEIHPSGCSRPDGRQLRLASGCVRLLLDVRLSLMRRAGQAAISEEALQLLHTTAPVVKEVARQA